jgi:hypothetical protein
MIIFSVMDVGYVMHMVKKDSAAESAVLIAHLVELAK